MSWLHSRRFYAGLLLGLVPLLLFAAQASRGTDGESEPNRVVVRNYEGRCPDASAAERTALLLETLPADVVLIENYTGCTDSSRVHGASSGIVGDRTGPPVRYAALRSPSGMWLKQPWTAPQTQSANLLAPDPDTTFIARYPGDVLEYCPNGQQERRECFRYQGELRCYKDVYCDLVTYPDPVPRLDPLLLPRTSFSDVGTFAGGTTIPPGAAPRGTPLWPLLGALAPVGGFLFDDDDDEVLCYYDSGPPFDPSAGNRPPCTAP